MRVAGAIEDKDWSGLKGGTRAISCSRSSTTRAWPEERGLFDFNDIVDAISRQDGCAPPARVWQCGGRERRRADRRLGGDQAPGSAPPSPPADCWMMSPAPCPALLRAEKLQKRMASVGFDWDSPERVLDKIAEEASEIVQARREGAGQAEIEGEVGDLFFVVANLARHLKVDPEQALRVTNAKVVRRFKWIEGRSCRTGPDNRRRDARRDGSTLAAGEDQGLSRRRLGKTSLFFQPENRPRVRALTVRACRAVERAIRTLRELAQRQVPVVASERIDLSIAPAAERVFEDRAEGRPGQCFGSCR